MLMGLSANFATKVQ